MKVLYKSPGNRFTVEFAGETQKEVFEDVADFQSVFEGNETCGFVLDSRGPVSDKDRGKSDLCGGQTYFNTRDVDGNKYYEKKCADCGATLTFHQNKKGGSLFLKWDDKWTRWAGKPKDDRKEDDNEVFDEPVKKSGPEVKENLKKGGK